MECFLSVVASFCERCGFQRVCHERDEDRIVNAELPLQCEVGVSPELVQRMKVFACFGDSGDYVFVGGAVAAECNFQVFGVLLDCEGGAVGEVNGVL